jgi:hypothetical protein
MTPGLSICCQVSDPPARVAAALEPLRALADQIVIGVDHRIALSDVAGLRDLADLVVPLACVARPDELRTPLLAMCTQPWILVIDSDEVVSTALLDVLPQLLAADDVVQYRIARRWCYPDLSHWLEETPWWPDFQNRLIRRDVAAIAGAGPHDGMRTEEPARYIGEPMYHLDCALSGYETRATKAALYEKQSPGRVPYGGGPFNETFYLPERYATQQLAATPSDDVELLERIVAADPRSREEFLAASDAGGTIAASPRPALPLAVDAYAAKLGVVERDLRFAPGERRPVLLEVHNLGSVVFSNGATGSPEVRVTYRLRDANGLVLVADGLRTHFPCAIEVGACELVPVLVEAPAIEGRYLVEFDLVHEGVRWFDAPVTVDIVVAGRWSRFAV